MSSRFHMRSRNNCANSLPYWNILTKHGSNNLFTLSWWLLLWWGWNERPDFPSIEQTLLRWILLSYRYFTRTWSYYSLSQFMPCRPLLFVRIYKAWNLSKRLLWTQIRLRCLLIMPCRLLLSFRYWSRPTDRHCSHSNYLANAVRKWLLYGRFLGAQFMPRWNFFKYNFDLDGKCWRLSSLSKWQILQPGNDSRYLWCGIFLRFWGPTI